MLFSAEMVSCCSTTNGCWDKLGSKAEWRHSFCDGMQTQRGPFVLTRGKGSDQYGLEEWPMTLSIQRKTWKGLDRMWTHVILSAVEKQTFSRADILTCHSWSTATVNIIRSACSFQAMTNQKKTQCKNFSMLTSGVAIVIVPQMVKHFSEDSAPNLHSPLKNSVLQKMPLQNNMWSTV